MDGNLFHWKEIFSMILIMKRESSLLLGETHSGRGRVTNWTGMGQNLPVQLALPEAFVNLCRQDKVEPGTVLRGFIADLCAITDPESGYFCNGARATNLARGYYAQVGYVRWSS